MSEFLDTPELQDKVIVRLVDDDKDFLRSMKLMLEMMGWKVRDFSLAQDFLQEENFKVPGCIVLDMRMPGMTGLELQRQLINDKEKALPIIFLTGHGDVESAVHTLKRGAFDFLQKPVNPLKFNKTIEEACRLSLDNFGASLEDREVIKAFKSLTPREKEIFELAAGGKSNRVGFRCVPANTLSHHRPYRSGRPSHLDFTAVSQRSNLYSTLAMTNLFV